MWKHRTQPESQTEAEQYLATQPWPASACTLHKVQLFIQTELHCSGEVAAAQKYLGLQLAGTTH